MLIKISERYKPFTHQVGHKCCLPRTSLVFEIFPTKINVSDISKKDPLQIAALTNNLEAPVSNFLVQQDLEKGCIRVEGAAKNGFFRYIIHSSQEGDGYFIESKVPMEWEGNTGTLSSYPSCKIERLHLGVTKKQDWDLVLRRGVIAEILPFWFLLGQLTPKYESLSEEESLLTTCMNRVQSKEHDKICSTLNDVFVAGFSGLLVPNLEDSCYRGYAQPPIVADSPLALLSAGSSLIRSLFFLENSSEELSILPSLPPEFPSGRLIGLQVSDGSVIDIEWSKKTLRRMVFYARSSEKKSFVFQPKIKSYRLRMSQEKKESQRFKVGDALEFEAGCKYYFDNFQL
ncbi:MAG: hypothetical protein VX777_06015 [Chlamydiota bacterium]|nr:hypothetical protein [Chlamydiota bacterium]